MKASQKKRAMLASGIAEGHRLKIRYLRHAPGLDSGGGFGCYVTF
jgi:hypothetical protein